MTELGLIAEVARSVAVECDLDRNQLPVPETAALLARVQAVATGLANVADALAATQRTLDARTEKVV